MPFKGAEDAGTESMEVAMRARTGQFNFCHFQSWSVIHVASSVRSESYSQISSVQRGAFGAWCNPLGGLDCHWSPMAAW